MNQIQNRGIEERGEWRRRVKPSPRACRGSESALELESAPISSSPRPRFVPANRDVSAIAARDEDEADAEDGNAETKERACRVISSSDQSLSTQ